MLNTCFGHAPNDRKTNANATKVLKPNHGKSFESRAFDALYLNRHKYQISELYRCHAARMDGYLVTTDGETILLEMKECLGWPALQAASSQFLMGKALLKLNAKRAIIVFERISDEWSLIKPHGGWGQLALHATELSPHIEIGGLQI